MRLLPLLAAVVTVPLVQAADPALVRLVGSEAQTVAGIQVTSTLASPFGQFLLGEMQRGDVRFRTFIDSTGFDPRRDLREVLMVSTGADRKAGYVLAAGVFNGPQIMDAARKHGGRTFRQEGVEVAAAPGADGPWVAILDGSIAVAGEATHVQGVLARRNAASKLDAKLTDKISEYSGLFDVWFVSMSPSNTIPANAFGPKSPMPAGQALQAVQQASAGLKFGSTVRFAGEAVTQSDKDASALVDVIRFVAGLMQSSQKPEAARFQSLLNSLELSSQANVMKFSLAVPHAELEQMFRSGRVRTL